MPVAAPIAGGLAAGAAGALLGGSGSKQKSTTVSNDPWSGVQPYLRDLFARAQGQLNSGSLAPGNSLLSQAASSYANAANSPLISQAQNQLGQTIGGQYLSPTSNPYLSGAVQQALDQVKQNVNSQFRGDNFGSSANQEFLAKTLANTALPIYAQNYSNERQNQLNAITAAPGLTGASGDLLSRAGQAQQTQLDRPFQELQRYQSLISGQPGGSTTSPYFVNPAAQAAGGALGGLQLYKAFGGPGLMSGLFGSGGGSFGGADVGGYAPGSPY